MEIWQVTVLFEPIGVFLFRVRCFYDVITLNSTDNTANYCTWRTSCRSKDSTRCTPPTVPILVPTGWAFASFLSGTRLLSLSLIGSAFTSVLGSSGRLFGWVRSAFRHRTIYIDHSLSPSIPSIYKMFRQAAYLSFRKIQHKALLNKLCLISVLNGWWDVVGCNSFNIVIQITHKSLDKENHYSFLDEILWNKEQWPIWNMEIENE